MPPLPHGLSVALPILGFAWALLWIAASIVYRRRLGKPIFNPTLEHAAFMETWRSGFSRRNLLTRVGGARNCLRVAVNNGALEVAPHFPFNLMFLPEIYRLEFSVPGTAIRSMQKRTSIFFGNGVRVTFERAGGNDEQFDIFLKDPQAFMDAVAAIRLAA